MKKMNLRIFSMIIYKILRLLLHLYVGLMVEVTPTENELKKCTNGLTDFHELKDDYYCANISEH